VFKTIRPVCFIAYGPEAWRVAYNHVKRTCRLTPELKGMLSFVLLSDPVEKSTAVPIGSETSIPTFDMFAEEGGDDLFVREVEVGDIAGLEDAFVRAHRRLTTGDLRRAAVENNWNVKQGVEPVIVTLIDPSSGNALDWIEFFSCLRKPFRNNELCLIDSFNVLLGPNFHEEGTPAATDEKVYDYFAKTFSILQCGNYHPATDVVWIPQTLVLDGRLDNGMSLIPNDDLRENVADIIIALVGLTLTDNSTFSEKETVRTAGAIRVGVPQKELIREHQEQWMRKYFDQQSSPNPENVRDHKCRQTALKFIRNSKVDEIEKLLSKNLSGKLNYIPDYPEEDKLSRLQFLITDFDDYWRDRIDQLPDRIISERAEFNRGQRAELYDHIGVWLEELSLDEVSSVLEMVRGVDNTGLVSHEDIVTDLRSLKVKRIDRLGRYRFSLNPERLNKYLDLKHEINDLLEKRSRLEDLQRELDSVQVDKIDEGSDELVDNPKGAQENSQPSASQSARFSRIKGELNQCEKADGELEELLAELSAPVALRIIEELESAKSVGYLADSGVSIEGWPGTAEGRKLSTGTQFVIPSHGDDKRIRDQYHLHLKELADLHSELAKEPDVSITDSEVIRRKSLLDSIEEKSTKVDEHLEQCKIAREYIEKYQVGVNSQSEQSARMRLIRDAIKSDLQLAPLYYRKLTNEKRDLEARLKKAESDRLGKKNRSKSTLLKQLGGVLLAILIAVLLVPSKKPTIVTTVQSVNISPGKQELAIKVGKSSVRVVFPNGFWNNHEIVSLLNGNTVRSESIGSLQSFKKLLTAEVSNGFLSISGNSSVSSFDAMEILDSSTAAHSFGLSLRQQFYGSSNWLYRFLAVLICSLVAAYYYWRYRSLTTGMTGAISRINSKIEQIKHDIRDWLDETEGLIGNSGEKRLGLCVHEEGIKSVDEQAQIVEHVQKDFEKFKSRIEKELRVAGEVIEVDSELPSNRRFYSIFSRAQLNEIILDSRTRALDDKNFNKFKEEWSYPKIWNSFSSSGAIDDWMSQLSESANESYKALLENTLEKLLTANPDILSAGHPLVFALQENFRPLTELCDVSLPEEQIRSFVCTEGNESNSPSIRERFLNIWPEERPSFVSEGSQSEMLLVVLKPNLYGRRILAVQKGMTALFREPVSETEDLFNAIGGRMDLLCNVHEMDLLSKSSGYGGALAPWQTLLNRFVSNLVRNETLVFRTECNSPVFLFGEVRLGCSIVEILFRLSGCGLENDQYQELKLALESPPESECVDYLDKLGALGGMFDKIVEHVDLELYRHFKLVEREALDDS
jgi:hypothetical protein